MRRQITRISRLFQSSQPHPESFFPNLDTNVLPWFEKLRRAANSTLSTSWADMDQVDEGSSSRSASGGTTWADGGWVNVASFAALQAMVDASVLADCDTHRWIRRLDAPAHLPLAEHPGFDITLHFLPAGATALPWRMPTGLPPPRCP